MNFSWLAAEFIGTFTLIFIGAGSICLNELNPGSVGLVGIALAHGLAIAVMVSALGHISGGKFNPAITIGVLVGKKINFKTALYEIIAQLAGAVVGAITLKQVFPYAIAHAVHLGTPTLGEGISVPTAIIVEAILSFILILTVYGTAIDPRGSFKAIAGFGIGSAIIFSILAAGGLTGVAINPARAFGPALISGHWNDQYVYWIGPIIGGIIAGFFYSKYLLKQSPQN